jgi:hypothetical protein
MVGVGGWEQKREDVKGAGVKYEDALGDGGRFGALAGGWQGDMMSGALPNIDRF